MLQNRLMSDDVVAYETFFWFKKPFSHNILCCFIVIWSVIPVIKLYLLVRAITLQWPFIKNEVIGLLRKAEMV